MAIQKEQVVAKALALLDEVGLDGLTMRRLAEAMEIKAASLYWHFANKQVLLDAMADALMADVAVKPPAPAQPWRARLAEVAGEMRRALLSRRDAARVYAGTYVATANVLRVGEAMTAPLREAGASAKVASWGAFSVLYFLLGFVIEESGATPEAMPGVDLEQRMEDFHATAMAGFPHLAAAREHIFDRDFDARFSFGLELMLDGLAARLAAEA
jgi:TetR/AcrR family tetracycline transcriptional repressor